MTSSERVSALINLATNANTPEAEARNAALEACRLIKRCNLALQDPRDVVTAKAETHAAPRSGTRQKAGSPTIGASLGERAAAKIITKAARRAADQITVGDVFNLFRPGK